MSIKIGFDIGNTINNRKNNLPFENSFLIIRSLIGKYESKNIYIISKAKNLWIEKSKKWLIDNKFYEITGFDINNLYFVDEYDEKKKLIDKLKINFFVDDEIKIIRDIIKSNNITKAIWFRGNNNLLNDFPKKLKYKIIISNKWNKIYKSLIK
jgi:hypothetical protein